MATAAERPGDPGRLEKPTTPNRTHGAAQAAGAARKAERGARGRSAWVCAPRGLARNLTGPKRVLKGERPA